MQSDSNTKWAGAGFTLFEILIAISVSAILAVVLVQFLSTQTRRSWLPIRNLNQSMALQSAMDAITSDYRNLLLTAPEPLVTLQDNIGDGDYGLSGTDIQVQSYCLEFVGTLGAKSEQMTRQTCAHTSGPGTDDDTLLRVTLSLGNQTLTSLFAR